MAGIISPGFSGKLATPQAVSNFSRSLRVVHPLIPGKDIRQRSHVAGALYIVLAPQRVDPAAFQAHVAQEHLEIGATDDIVDPAGMLGNPQGIESMTGFTARQAPGDFPDDLRRRSRIFRGPLRRVLHDLFLERIKTGAA